MKHLYWALPLVVVAIAGCDSASRLLEDPGVSVVAELDVQAPAARRVLQASGAWTAADIQAARIKLYRVDTGADVLLASQTLLGADVGGTITFSNLKRNTNYKITAEAWAEQAMTTQIDNYATSPSSCTTSFATTNVSPVVLSDGIKLQLKNTGFAGSTNGAGLTVTDGTIEDTTATETITVTP